MEHTKTYTIGQLAKLAGITTKTLRHYDRIGLLQPSARSDADYRLYSEADAHTLAEILAYRDLDMPLDHIAELLNARGLARKTRAQRLAAHLTKLQKERTRLGKIIEHVEDMLLHEQEGAPMSADKELNGFTDDPYHEEAKEKWGQSDAWQESQRRTKGYTAQDWERYKQEAADLNDRFVALMQTEIPANSEQAHALAEEHRQLISTWFYDCPPEMHANFGAMWEADPRFKENIDKTAKGLSTYMAEAFRANAAK